VIHHHDPHGALTAARSGTDGSGRAIVIVDNGSRPEERAVLEGGGFRLVGGGTDRGFAAGANDGIRALAVHPWIVLLNQDVVLDPDAVDRLVVVADPIASVAAATPLLRTQSGAVWFAGARYQRWRAAVVGSHVGEPADRVAPITVDSPFVTFAAVALRTDALRDVGLLSEDFHLYWEDVELCRRFHAHGWRTIVVRHATGVHERGRFGDPLCNLSPVMLFHDARNRLRFARATATRPELAVVAVATIPHVARRLWQLARAHHPSLGDQLAGFGRGLVAGCRDPEPVLGGDPLPP